MQTNIYTLPELTFVGGDTQSIFFHAVDSNGGTIDLDGASVDFSICNYSNKVGEPLVSITPILNKDEHDVYSVIYVSIPSSDTVGLFGKYIYQITIIDIAGRVEIPNQGIMNITKNINTSFIEL